MASSTLAEVVARFSEESGKIGEFMFSLKGHSCFRRRELDLFNSALKDTDIAAVSVPKKTHPEQLLSLEETHALADVIRDRIEEAESKLNGIHDLCAEEPTYPETGPAAKLRGLFDVIVEGMMKRLTPQSSAQERSQAFQGQLLVSASPKAKIADQTKALLRDLALDHAEYRLHEQEVSALTFFVSVGKEMQLRAQSASPKSEIHIYRQGLILLVTTFDAAVFDIVRIALRTDFFGLIGKFETEKSERLSLQQIGEYGEFTDFHF